MSLVTGDREGDIYKNSLNMMGVVVHMTCLDQDSHPMTVDEGFLMQCTTLINAGTRVPLNRDGNTGWSFAETPNEFTATPPTVGAEAAGPVKGGYGKQSITFYVSCSAISASFSMEIGCEIEINGNKQDIYFNCKGGDANKTVVLNAIPAVRYTEANTSLANAVAFADPTDGTTKKMRAVNYAFRSNQPGCDFFKFELDPPAQSSWSDGYYWSVFDSTHAYQLSNENFKRYQKFSIAYIWRGTDQSANVFGLRASKGGSQTWWPISIPQDGSTQFFTVIEYDSTLNKGTGFGFPGEPVNVPSPLAPGVAVNFTVWDQYGNSARLTPTTTDLLNGFKVTPMI